jgi:hypothetical protein
MKKKALSITSIYLILEGQFALKWIDAIFWPFRFPSSVSLFTMKYFMEIDNEVILLSNDWIWY